ncbi:hypothetical protein DAPPUDRAFT_302525 [Daphnia pulex]|uniref:Uncharacterized protein n=1 Tax=Daphnia pulex TaxID=6669 RepID=E9GDM7_DAPPU|nr:hypothetical protein DAPPUDRAFT_302525 [Daphnia pulex]|eukprot:EFX82108.1 hypothetical protein DAPPUDRAFT_302525 [Daphnia pulex]
MSFTQLILAVLLVATTSWTDVTCKSVQPLKKEVWNELNCNKPQSRLAYLEDEYHDYNSEAVYLPHAAVVQYCDNSLGCCRKGHLYVATKEEKMTFAFQEILHGTKMKKEIELTNHLRCVCQSIGSH